MRTSVIFRNPGSVITNDYLSIQAAIVKKQTISGTTVQLHNMVERAVSIKIE
jgi:hypothetical protein